MTIGPEILPILRCPSGGGSLSLADSGVIERVNQMIAQGKARDQLDQLVQEAIDAGLVNQSADRLYPIRGGIPTLIADEAIGLPKELVDETSLSSGEQAE